MKGESEFMLSTNCSEVLNMGSFQSMPSPIGVFWESMVSRGREVECAQRKARGRRSGGAVLACPHPSSPEAVESGGAGGADVLGDGGAVSGIDG